MFDSRFPTVIAGAFMAAARTLDASLAAASIENARGALIQGRRAQVIRSILEDLEETSGELIPIVSDAG